jgi:hypothetical protein
MKIGAGLWIDHREAVLALVPDMYLETSQDVLFFVTYGFAILILSLLADRKNRNPLAWGLIGGLFFPCSLVCLLLESPICPKCKQALTKLQWKQRSCATCGPLGRVKHDASLIPAHEGTL